MSYIRDKDKNQILEELYGTAEPGSTVHEQQKMGIIVRCTEDLEKAMDALRHSAEQNAKSSESLGRKVFWLNIVVGAATIVGAIATAYQAFQG